MSSFLDLYDQLKAADEAGEVAVTRYLCEKILDSDPDHVPTLIRYADCLDKFAQYQESAAVLDRADSVAPGKYQHWILDS